MQRYQALTQADIELIHENSLRILEEVGVVMQYAPALEVFRKHGAKVDGETVYIPRALVEKSIDSAPSEFTLYARDPKRNVVFNTEDTHYTGPGGSSFAQDLDEGRRLSTREDFIKLVKLFQSLDLIEMHHVPCDMNDVDPAVRNREVAYLMMKYSNKPFMGFMFSYEEAKTIIAMAAVPFGGLEAVRNKPVTILDPCSVTPLAYDDKGLSALMAFAEYGQMQLINSLCMAGTTAPVTLAGNVSVQNAEILAGIVLAQCINPGTPVVYSASSSISDMKTGNLVVGTPETALISIVNGQLAKFYGLPCRISGAITDSKGIDIQAGYESMMNLMTAEMAGGNFILHSGGILAGYDTVSFEKAIIDHELCGMVWRISRGMEVNEKTLAFDVIKEVGPQGQFLSQKHTIKNFRKEFYTPQISDRSAYSEKEDAGALSMEQKANMRWKELLENYKAPEDFDEMEPEIKKIMEM